MLRSDTFAIIDVGSNAVRLFVARLKGSHAVTVADLREPVRLGRDAFDRGWILPKTLRQLTDCLWKFRLRAMRHGALHIWAVATSALRDAKNSEAVRHHVWAKTGVTLELIDGICEATLLHRAVASAMSLRSGPHLLADLGGGSLELVACDEKKVRSLWSLNIGTVRLLNRIGRDQTYTAYARALEPELAKVAAHPHFVRDIIFSKKFIGTGGNFRALQKLLHHFHFPTPFDQLHIEHIERVATTLFRLDEIRRSERLRLRPDRADVIRPATVIILEIMKHFCFERVTVPNVGIKNGLFWTLVDQVSNAAACRFPNIKSKVRSTNNFGFSTLQQ